MATQLNPNKEALLNSRLFLVPYQEESFFVWKALDRISRFIRSGGWESDTEVKLFLWELSGLGEKAWEAGDSTGAQSIADCVESACRALGLESPWS